MVLVCTLWLCCPRTSACFVRLFDTVARSEVLELLVKCVLVGVEEMYVEGTVFEWLLHSLERCVVWRTCICRVWCQIVLSCILHDLVE